jgi:Protein of unknown function (DUF3093)
MHLSSNNRHKNLAYGVRLYSEKMSWPIWLWAFIAFMSGSIDLALWVALSGTVAGTVTLISALLIIYANRKSALKITVTKGWLLVGPAAIERAFIHNFQALDASQLRRARGVEADPACFMELRFWVNRGIKISLRDPKDKTPYWLVSTKKGPELVNLLNLAEH